MTLRLLVGALSCTILLTTWAASPGEASVPSKRAWLTDVSQAMSGSQRYVDNRVARDGRKPAVNFDIDNSTLATHYDPGKAIAVVLRFANNARRDGVKLLFNTGRHRGDGRLIQAKRQLTNAGYKVAEICGRQRGEPLTHSKQRCRRHFVSEGYTLIANLGNRRTDFTGGNYERAFRLPNYNNQLS
ncbi:MAG: HAD family acid phosphatase [Nocardioidaceae bacterium]